MDFVSSITWQSIRALNSELEDLGSNPHPSWYHASALKQSL